MPQRNRIRPVKPVTTAHFGAFRLTALQREMLLCFYEGRQVQVWRERSAPDPAQIAYWETHPDEKPKEIPLSVKLSLQANLRCFEQLQQKGLVIASEAEGKVRLTLPGHECVEAMTGRTLQKKESTENTDTMQG